MKLKNCVWCGGSPTEVLKEEFKDELNDTWFYGTSCKKCGWKLTGFDTKAECRKEWNALIDTADSREFNKS